MRTMIRGIAASACVMLLVSACAFAQDWPQWRGVNRDGKADFTAPAEWPKELTKTWTATVGEGDATPALVGDKLYVFAREGSMEVIRCISAADGKESWKDGYPIDAIGGPAGRAHAGPRSSPAVVDGKVVTLGVKGTLSCLNAADGKLIWRKDFQDVPQFFTGVSPMVADGMVIAQLGGQGKGGLVALDLATGNEKWTCDGQPAMYASPVLATIGDVKQVVSLSEKGLFGVALADGKMLWEFPFAPTGRMGYNACTPIVDGDVIYVSGSGRGTKAVKIEKNGDAFAPKELWKSDLAVQFNTPLLKDGLLYGLTDRGSLFCINAKDGSTGWTKEVMTGRGGGFAAVVDAGTAVLALPNNSELIVLKPGGKAYDEAAKYKVSDAQTYASPVVSGKRIFIKAGDALTLFTLP